MGDRAKGSQRDPVGQILVKNAKAAYLQNRGLETEERHMVAIEESKLEEQQEESYVCGQ